MITINVVDGQSSKAMRAFRETVMAGIAVFRANTAKVTDMLRGLEIEATVNVLESGKFSMFGISEVSSVGVLGKIEAFCANAKFPFCLTLAVPKINTGITMDEETGLASRKITSNIGLPIIMGTEDDGRDNKFTRPRFWVITITGHPDGQVRFKGELLGLTKQRVDNQNISDFLPLRKKAEKGQDGEPIVETARTLDQAERLFHVNLGFLRAMADEVGTAAKTRAQENATTAMLSASLIAASSGSGFSNRITIPQAIVDATPAKIAKGKGGKKGNAKPAPAKGKPAPKKVVEAGVERPARPEIAAQPVTEIGTGTEG